MKSNQTLLLETVEILLTKYRQLHNSVSASLLHQAVECSHCAIINKAQKLYDRITRSNAKSIDRVSKILEELNK